MVISEKANVLFLKKYIRENIARTIRVLSVNTNGDSVIRPKASSKLFLSAASRKMLIQNENTTRKMKEGIEEHIKLSNPERHLIIKFFIYPKRRIKMHFLQLVSFSFNLFVTSFLQNNTDARENASVIIE